MNAELLEQLSSEVDRDRLTKSLAAMVATPSVNPFDENPREGCRELEFADLYEDEMASLGLHTARREVAPGRPNIFGRLRGSDSKKCVMLAGHMDTVGVEGCDDPFNPVIENGRLHGRGSCDMKAALAAYLETVRIINHHGIRLGGDLIIAGVVDEEHMMMGAKEISENGPIPDFAIVGEPTGLKVCRAHKGQLCMPVRTFGKAAHSGVPELGVNAITSMADVIKEFENYAAELGNRPAHPACGRPRVNPGVIKGGTISSSVPDYCELEVDRRFLPGENMDTIAAEYRDILNRITSRNPNFRAEIGPPVLNNPPLDTPAESEVVTSIAGAFQSVVGRPADVGAFPAATDAPHFLCPAVVCGPGRIAQAHTPDEYVHIDEVTAAARIYIRTVVELLA